MKVVINTDFGSFRLSPKAVKMLMEKKGLPCYVYFISYIEDALYRVDSLDDNINKKSGCYFRYSTKDIGEYSNFEENADYWWNYRSIDRTDKDLIAVVENLGEEANDCFSRLKIVEIPDDVEWVIEEYDGMESIHEKHRIWS